MYQLEDSQLRVCNQYVNNPQTKERFSNCRFILLQHILSDTEELIKLISETGADIFAILAKPFSIDNNVLERLHSKYRIIRESYDTFDNTPFLENLLNEAVEKSNEDEKDIVILEVGGYFSKTLTKLNSDQLKYIKGVVEVTTFGHNKYIEHASKIKIPIYSVARSPIKTIEATYVGRAAVTAIDQVLREIGVSVAGRQALVIGFGMIGRSVADALKAHNLLVSVYDKKGFGQLNAYTQGYFINNKFDLLKNADIIFSSTAERALSYEDIENCKNNVILASVGSRGNEFDMEGLKHNAIEIIPISDNIQKYVLSKQKNIFVVREGTAVNFIIKSCPDEIVDLIHAEVLICTNLLLNEKRERNKIGIVNHTPEKELHQISRDWLKHVV